MTRLILCALFAIICISRILSKMDCSVDVWLERAIVRLVQTTSPTV